MKSISEIVKNVESTYWDLFNATKRTRVIATNQSFKNGHHEYEKTPIPHLVPSYEKQRELMRPFRNAVFESFANGGKPGQGVLDFRMNPDLAGAFPDWGMHFTRPNFHFNFPKIYDARNGYWLMLRSGWGERNGLTDPNFKELGLSNEVGQLNSFHQLAKRDPERLHGVVAVDLETTGLSPMYAEIIEIGIAYWAPGITDINDVERFRIRFDMQRDDVKKQLGTGPMHIHNITPEEITGLPKFTDKKVQKLLQKYLCSGHLLLMHNAMFEFNWFSMYLDNFFASNIDQWGMPDNILDTMYMTKGLLEGTKKNKLENLINHVGLSYSNAHSAMADSMMSLIAANEVFDHFTKTNARFQRQYKPKIKLNNYHELLTIENQPEDIQKFLAKL